MRNFGSKVHFIYRCKVLPQNSKLEQHVATGPGICLNGIISELFRTKIDCWVDCNRFQDHNYFALGARSKKSKITPLFAQMGQKKWAQVSETDFIVFYIKKYSFLANISHEKVFQEKRYKPSKNGFFNVFAVKSSYSQEFLSNPIHLRTQLGSIPPLSATKISAF